MSLSNTHRGAAGRSQPGSAPNTGTETSGFTLPLFGQGQSSERPARQAEAPKARVLHAYWSAAVEANALAEAIRVAALPSERRALAALHQKEIERREFARRLLEEVWGVRIGRGENRARQSA